MSSFSLRRDEVCALPANPACDPRAASRAILISTSRSPRAAGPPCVLLIASRQCEAYQYLITAERDDYITLVPQPGCCNRAAGLHARSESLTLSFIRIPFSKDH